MKGVQVHYDVEGGWFAEVPIALAAPELGRICDFVRKAQTQRISTWPRGPKREQAEAALKLLSPATINQRIVPRNVFEQDRILY